MSDFINATVSFGVVISINGKDKIKDLTKKVGDLIMKDTDWMGEPKNANGCIVSMHPKEFQLNGNESSSQISFEQIDLFSKIDDEVEATSMESERRDSSEFIVKAVRKGDAIKLLKSADKIASAIAEDEGYTLVLQTKAGGMKFASIETMVGRNVGFMDNGKLITATVGGKG